MLQAATSAEDDAELRSCIRALVTVIRQANVGESPVQTAQLAHIRKVVRLLSLSEAQLAEMDADERAKVLTIRDNAIQKMKLANSLHSSSSGSAMPNTPIFSPASVSTPPAAGGTSPEFGRPIGPLRVPMAPPPTTQRGFASAPGHVHQQVGFSPQAPMAVPGAPAQQQHASFLSGAQSVGGFAVPGASGTSASGAGFVMPAPLGAGGFSMPAHGGAPPHIFGSAPTGGAMPPPAFRAAVQCSMPPPVPGFRPRSSSTGTGRVLPQVPQFFGGPGGVPSPSAPSPQQPPPQQQQPVGGGAEGMEF